MKQNNLMQFEGNLYDKYHTKNIVEKKLMSNFFDKINKALSIEQISPQYILEAGCGEGYVLNYLSNLFPQAKLKGFDISREVIAKAKKDYASLKFETGSIYDIKEEDGKYELVVACEVLEHLEKPKKGLTELLRVSSKYVLLSVPSEPLWCLLNLLRGKYIKNFGNTPGHIQHWNKRSFLKMLRNQKGIAIKYTKLPIPWIIVLIEKI